MFSPADGADSHHGILVSAEVFTCTGSFILIFSEVALRIFNWSPSVNWHQPGITVGGLSQPSPCTKWKYTPDGVRAHYRMHNSHWGEFTAGLSNVQPAYDPPTPRSTLHKSNNCHRTCVCEQLFSFSKTTESCEQPPWDIIHLGLKLARHRHSNVMLKSGDNKERPRIRAVPGACYMLPLWFIGSVIKLLVYSSNSRWLKGYRFPRYR